MNTLLILLAIYIIPIFIIFLCMYLLMDKNQSVNEFIEEQNIDDTLIIAIIIPMVNIGLMICAISYIICDKIGNWRK